MLRDLFTNACILVTILFIASQLFQNINLNPYSPLKIRVFLGLYGGVSICLLIYFSIHVSPLIILDFRHISEILVALFGGPVSAIIAGIIGAVFRLTYMGVTQTSIIVSIIILLVCIVCGLISKLKIKNTFKWLSMLISFLLIRSSVYFILLENGKDIFKAIWVMLVSTILVSIAVYYFVQYLVTTQNMFIKLKKESTKDFLTGLNNTRQYDFHINSIKQQLEIEQIKVSMLILDIDHFKNVNDTYGHVAGDEVLKQLGLLLVKESRNSDVAFRIGGEEFSIIMKNLSVDETVQIAERIRKQVQINTFKLPGGKNLKITISIGVAVYPDTSDDLRSLKEAADMKLYEAKRSGRNKVCI